MSCSGCRRASGHTEECEIWTNPESVVFERHRRIPTAEEPLCISNDSRCATHNCDALWWNGPGIVGQTIRLEDLHATGTGFICNDTGRQLYTTVQATRLFGRSR